MNNPLDYFDAIYCINLDERTDRWEHSLKQFEKFGISDRVERFSAIKPERDERWDRPTPWGWPNFPLVGAVGCAESRKAVIQFAKDRELDNVLVLEDDFVVCDNWEENLKCALCDLEKQNWHNFYLGYHLHNMWGLKKKVGECLTQAGGTKFRGIQLTVGLAYNSTIFDYLIEDIDPFDWNKQGREGHVDKYFARNININKFYVNPMVVEPNFDFESDLK